MAEKLLFDIPGRPLVKRTRKPWGVFFQRDEADEGMLDGQQRVTSVLDYMADGFPVFGRHFSELTVVDHRIWGMTTAFPCMETNIEDEAQLRDVYDRLAYGGTPHDPADRAVTTNAQS